MMRRLLLLILLIGISGCMEGSKSNPLPRATSNYKPSARSVIHQGR